MAHQIEIGKQEILDKIEDLEVKIKRLNKIISAIDIIEEYYNDENGEDFSGDPLTIAIDGANND